MAKRLRVIVPGAVPSWEDVVRASEYDALFARYQDLQARSTVSSAALVGIVMTSIASRKAAIRSARVLHENTSAGAPHSAGRGGSDGMPKLRDGPRT